MAEPSYLSGKTSTRISSQRRRFNPIGIFKRSEQHGSSKLEENELANMNQSSLEYHFCHPDISTRPMFWQDRLSSTKPAILEEFYPSARPEWLREAVTSGSDGSSTQSTSIASTTSDVHVRTGYLKHIDPVMIQVKASSISQELHVRSTRDRKRSIQLRPKSPKYKGLSRFAAPKDLLSNIIPSGSIDPEGTNLCASISTSPPAFQATLTSPSIRKKLNRPVQEHLKCKKEGAVMVNPRSTGSETPVDFLKNIGKERWVQREEALVKMAIERRDHFLRTGFGDASGKPFPPDEPAIEKKPVPNRWVWYLRISMAYDTLNATVVPSGGPAGYLKHGWDRMGKEKKQVFQELTDVYSAQRNKFLSDHGINLTIINGLHQAARNTSPDMPGPGSPQLLESVAQPDGSLRELEDYKTSTYHHTSFDLDRNNEGHFHDLGLSTAVHISAKETFADVLESSNQPYIPNYFSNDNTSGIVPSPNSTESLATSSTFDYNVTEDTCTFSPYYLQSQDFMSDFQMSVAQQGIAHSAELSNPDQCLFDSPITLNQPASEYITDYALSPFANSTFWPCFDMNHSSPVESVSSARSSSSLMTPMAGTGDPVDHRMASTCHLDPELTVTEQIISPRFSIHAPLTENPHSDWEAPALFNEEFSSVEFDIDGLLYFH